MGWQNVREGARTGAAGQRTPKMRGMRAPGHPLFFYYHVERHVSAGPVATGPMLSTCSHTTHQQGQHHALVITERIVTRKGMDAGRERQIRGKKRGALRKLGQAWAYRNESKHPTRAGRGKRKEHVDR